MRHRDHAMNEIDRFYSLLQSGMSVAEFLRCYEGLFPFIRSNGLTLEYRLAKGPLKRLRDEVTPAYQFIRQHAALDDKIQFPLDDGPHDCNIWHRKPARHRTIQITVVQGVERFFLMTELNETGCGRGFVGLNDNSSRRAFKKKMAQEREMYSTGQVRTAMVGAFRLCADNKRQSQSNTLIISASMAILPRSRWMEMQSELAEPFSRLSFSEVYVVSDEDKFCWQLK